jgi:co-chaperonin GroES (HSP10)
MRIKPLTGQVLLRELPCDDKTSSGLWIPPVANDAQRGEKTKPFKALVIALGPWKKNSRGCAFLPPVAPGSEVICDAYHGERLSRTIGENLRLVDSDAILAVIEENSTTAKYETTPNLA